MHAGSALMRAHRSHSTYAMSGESAERPPVGLFPAGEPGTRVARVGGGVSSVVRVPGRGRTRPRGGLLPRRRAVRLAVGGSGLSVVNLLHYTLPPGGLSPGLEAIPYPRFTHQAHPRVVGRAS